MTNGSNSSSSELESALLFLEEVEELFITWELFVGELEDSWPDEAAAFVGVFRRFFSPEFAPP